jgi:stress response protein SCP2
MQTAFQGGNWVSNTQAEKEADPEVQQTLSMSDLDLDVSYLGVFQPSPQVERDTISYPQLSSAGWTPYDGDLDPWYETYQSDSR